MPHKFRKHVWIKRGDYVVTEAIPEGNKVRAEIVQILMKDHIQYIMQNDKWPQAFAQHSEEEEALSDRLQDFKVNEAGESDTESDENDLLMENPNRQRIYVEESSSSESDAESHEEKD